MRVFVNNVDGFLAGAICADLWKTKAGSKNDIIGTKKQRFEELVPPVVKRIVPRIEIRKLLKDVASCSVVIYDLHDADFEELELVLRTLQISELSQEITFILVSSVGVWARTQRDYEDVPVPPPPVVEQEADAGEEGGEAPAAEEEGESPPEVVEPPPPERRPRALVSEDYTRRVPAPKFQEWRSIETMVLALKEKGTVHPYVVCAGIPYGNGEDAFLGLFKAAWQTQDCMRIIGDGKNYIPLVHARDVARTIRHIVEEKPQLDYHLCVDRGDVTQRALVQAAADQFGIPYEIKSVSVVEAILAELADILTMDLRLEPSAIMGQPSDNAAAEAVVEAPEAPPAGEGDEPADGGNVAAEVVPAPPPGFRWWCEDGIVSNIEKVASEFCRWRRLQPVRVCIIGPPGSGAGDLAAQIAGPYHVPALVFDELVEEQRAAETALGQQVREKLDEITTALGNPKSQGPFLLPSALAAEVVEAAVTSKPARFRGFVLAGYPQTAEEAGLTFTEDKAEVGEDGQPGETTRVTRASLSLDAVVVASSSEEACLTRVQSSAKPMEQKEFQLKMDRWKKECPEDAPALADILKEHYNSEVVQVSMDDCSIDAEAASIVSLVQKRRPVLNFWPPPRGTESQQAEETPQEAAPANTEETAKLEAEAKKKKDQEERLEKIKHEEITRLEKHSEPLRQYLMSLIVPTLTTGLIEVCHHQPEDPVGYLAEYLSVYAEMQRKHGRRSATKQSNTTT